MIDYHNARWKPETKQHSLREQGIEDNVWTQGEENKGRTGGKKLHKKGLLYFCSSCIIIRAIKSEGM